MYERDLKQSIKEEVSDVLDKFGLRERDRNVIKHNITDILADQVIRGLDIETTKHNVISILQNANLSEEQASDITNTLLWKSGEIALSLKSLDSALMLGKDQLENTFPVSPMQREAFEQNAEREILNFFNDNSTKQPSPRNVKDTRQLAKTLGRIIADPDIINQEELLQNAVSQYMGRSSIQLGVPKEQLTKELASRLQNLSFKTSTPRKKTFDKENYFYPKRDSTMSSIYIDADTSDKRYKNPVLNNIEQKYTNELTELIKSWVDKLPIDLNDFENKGFKNTMIQDLAGDIVDRQKYLQLNTKAKTSDEEELKHLEYQVFRWMNKMLSVTDLATIIPKTGDLMDKIKNVEVPLLVEDKAIPGSRQADKIVQGEIPNVMDVLEDEISLWMEDIPHGLYGLNDKQYQRQMIRELAAKIQELKDNNKASDIDGAINDWLNKLVKKAHENNLNQMADDLKSKLKFKGLTGESWMPTQNSSQFIEENLMGGVLDWIKSLPLYRNSRNEDKRKLESLAQDIVKGLKMIGEQTGGNPGDLVMQEIMKHINKFPLTPEQSNDKDFNEKTAALLFNFLKDLRLFQDLTDRLEPSRDVVLLENIEEWMGSLPISARMLDNKTELGNLKREFMAKIKAILQEGKQEGSNARLKNEIKNYFAKLPIDPISKKDINFMNDKVEQLLKNLQAVLVEKTVNKVIDNLVKDVVTEWYKSLPVQIKPSQDIQNMVKVFSGIISNAISKTNADKLDKIRDNLMDETLNFLYKLQLQISNSNDMQYIAQQLFDKLKESLQTPPKSAAVETSIPKPVKKTADVLIEDIEEWCDKIPISTGNEAEDKDTKRNIANKLLHKIGELHMNPEVFNDEFLYQDLLQDEIDNLLSSIPTNPEFEKNIPILREKLIDKVKEARHKSKDEHAGQVYKQQLRDVISKTLTSQVNLPTEGIATFEALKDSVADAFINLHYVGDDKELKDKYKNKINDEVNKFCKDYLKRYPALPIDSRKLNDDLYTALVNVPMPKEDTIRKEVEIVKLKDEINDWLKDIPMKDQGSQLQTNKMIPVLAKKLHDIEKVKATQPSLDTEAMIKREVDKWMKKLPIETKDDKLVNEYADKLINNLRTTEDSRRVSASTRQPIKVDDFDISKNTMAPTDSHKPEQSTCDNICAYTPVGPPSSLSMEDRAYLRKIRERNMKRPRIEAASIVKHACVNLLPTDAVIQTEIPLCTPTCLGRSLRQASSSQTMNQSERFTRDVTKPIMEAVGSQAEVSPRIIIKEYFWDTDTGKLQCNRKVCSPQCSNLQLNSQPPQTSTQSIRTQREPLNRNISPQMVQQPLQNTEPRTPVMSQHYTQENNSYITTPHKPGMRREWQPFPQPCFEREEVSGPCHECPYIGTSRSFRVTSPKARVTHLGSFDNVQEGESKRPQKAPDFDWSSMRFPENDTDFWRKTSDDDVEPFVKEREKKEERVRCRCRERVFTNCSGRRRQPGSGSCQSCEDNLKRCPKCCGVRCPHPSYLYFRH